LFSAAALAVDEDAARSKASSSFTRPLELWLHVCTLVATANVHAIMVIPRE
jgi:hypothetical protein